MSEERPTTRQGFFSRMFAPGDEGTEIYSSEEVGIEEIEESVEPRGFTVERAAEVIKNLPPEVPRPAAVRIVRGTLEAAGIDITDLATSTKARESKLNSEIELCQGRIQKLKEDAEEAIRSLEEEIRKTREARDSGVAEQERKISEARTSLGDVEMVRNFFGLPRGDAETTADLPAGEETQVMEQEDDTQILRRPGPLSQDYWNAEESRDR
jgi:uncharacterized Zn finger protein (UPF0148 family)